MTRGYEPLPLRPLAGQGTLRPFRSVPLGGTSVQPPADLTRRLAAERTIRERAEQDRDALAKALENTVAWLTAALECKTWSWDADQHEAATATRDDARATLARLNLP